MVTITCYSTLGISAQTPTVLPIVNQTGFQERIVVGAARAPAAAKNEATEAEKGIRDDLASAVKLLEEKNYSEFFVRHMPIDIFRSIRGRKDYSEIINKAPKKDIDGFIEEIQQFKDAEVKFGPNNLTAVLKIELKTEEIKPISLKSAPALRGKAEGYGDDLKVAIQRAIKDLQSTEGEPRKAVNAIRFGKSFLPLSEVAYWENVGWDRFEKSLDIQVLHPVDIPAKKPVYNSPLAWKTPNQDLDLISKLEPKLENSGTKAVFAVPHPVSPFPEPKNKREIIFELVDGNWRYADSAKEMKATIEEQFKNKPLSSSNTKTLEMEKLGTTWRFTPQSFR